MAEVWLNISGYCGFSTRTTHFTRLPIATSARSTLYETCWIVKSDRMKNEKQTVMVWTEGRVMSSLQDSHGQDAGIKYFFPSFSGKKKNITKNPFYACYEWPLVSASWALGSGRKKRGDLGMWWRKRRWSLVVVRGGDGKQMKRKMIRCCESQGRKE